MEYKRYQHCQTKPFGLRLSEISDNAAKFCALRNILLLSVCVASIGFEDNYQECAVSIRSD